MNDAPLGPKVRWPYEGDVRWAFLKMADIESARWPGHVYLRRCRIFQTPRFALYLHFIYEPDDDRDPHDHPCNFWSMILRGGYVEHVYKGVRKADHRVHIRRRRLGTIAKMPLAWAHRIHTIKPRTVTLCWFGKRQQGWGFWTSDGFVPFKNYARTGTAPDPFGS